MLYDKNKPLIKNKCKWKFHEIPCQLEKKKIGLLSNTRHKKLAWVINTIRRARRDGIIPVFKPSAGGSLSLD